MQLLNSEFSVFYNVSELLSDVIIWNLFFKLNKIMIHRIRFYVIKLLKSSDLGLICFACCIMLTLPPTHSQPGAQILQFTLLFLLILHELRRFAWR